MKYIVILGAVVFVGMARSIIPATKASMPLKVASLGAARFASDSSKEVSGSVDLTPSTVARVQTAAEDLHMVDRSDPNPVVSITEIVSGLDHSFSTQRPDVEWSSRSEAQVRALFRPLMSTDTTLISVMCRSTLCRVEFLHTTDAEFHSFLNNLRTNGVLSGWKGESIGGRVGTNIAGEVKSVFYFAKEGSSLPAKPPIPSARGKWQNSATPKAHREPVPVGKGQND